MASKKSKSIDAPSHPTLKNLSEAYIASIQMDGRSTGTASSYANDLKVAEKYFGEETALRDLTIERVAEYFVSAAVMRKRSGELKNVISIAKTRRILRLALCWAADSGWIDEAPIPTIAKDDGAPENAPASETPTDARTQSEIADAPAEITIAVEREDSAAAEGTTVASVADPSLPSFDHPELTRDEPAADAPVAAPKKRGGKKSKATVATE